MVATKDELLAALDDLIDEKKLTITYKWFSRQYDVPYDVSKQLLYERSQTRPGAASGATYFVSGVKKDAAGVASRGGGAEGVGEGREGAPGAASGEADGGAVGKAASAAPAHAARRVVALLVSAERLERCRRDFARISGFHVHSLGPPRARVGEGPAPASPLSAEAATLAGAALEQAQAERLLAAGLQLEGVPLTPDRLQEVAGADPPPGTLFSKAALLPIRPVGISRGDADEDESAEQGRYAKGAPTSSAPAPRAAHGSPSKKPPAHASFASRFGGRSAFGATNEGRDGAGASTPGEGGGRAAPVKPAAFAGGASMLPGRAGGIEGLLKGKKGKAGRESKDEGGKASRASKDEGGKGAKDAKDAGDVETEAERGGAKREEPAAAGGVAEPAFEPAPAPAPASRSRLSLKKKGSQASPGSPDAGHGSKASSSCIAGSSKRRLRAIESDSESDDDEGEGRLPEYQDEEPQQREAAGARAPRATAAGEAKQGRLSGASGSPPKPAGQARTPFGAQVPRGDAAAAPATRKRMRTYYNDDGEEVTELVEEETGEDERGAEGSGDAKEKPGRGTATPTPAPGRPSGKPKGKPAAVPAPSRAGKGKSSGGTKKQAGIASFFTRKA